MKINIILVDECGDEVVAECIEAKTIEALGDYLDDFVDMRIEKIRRTYREARGVYREDVKSYSEMRADQYQELFEENLEWAKENPDEIDNMDPIEWAIEATQDYFNYDYDAGMEW